jgi:FkbM family methyltransferase
MDIVGGLIWRLAGPVSPALRARLLWRFRGDAGGRSVLPDHVGLGATVVDIGANHGLFTDRLARMVGPTGAVHAFEPNPAWSRDIRRIAATHGNVTFHPLALSSRSGRAQLTVPMRSGVTDTAMGTLEHRPPGFEAEVVDITTSTLDDELAGAARIHFVKCDVEGHEHEVLVGAHEILRRDRPVLYVEIEQRHRSRPLDETFALLADLGYAGAMVTRQGTRDLREFDIVRHQQEVIASDPQTNSPPPDYVSDFLFVPGEQPGTTRGA